MNSLQNSPKYQAALIRDRLTIALSEALCTAGIDGITEKTIRIERARDQKFGDLACNVAMVVAKKNGWEPSALAQKLIEHLEANMPAGVASISLAGRGFINFKLQPFWLHEVLNEVLSQGVDGYARHAVGSGESVLIEFISANPTGPMHIGNGWWGSYGDALARLFKQCGYAVQREYYVNDTGNQIRQLGKSILALKRGEEVPEDGYKGAYVKDLALLYQGPEEVMAAGKWAADQILEQIKATLKKADIEFDNWFSQASIEESGAVQETIELLKQRGLIYEQDGAVFVKSTEYGDNRDRVLVKKDGDYTYFAGDIAYHRNKFLVRGFTHAIDIFGADHQGHVASLHAGVKALGVDEKRLEIRLGQMISMVDGTMSKRSGNFVTLEWLIDEIGPGAVRFHNLTTDINEPRTINLKEMQEQSMKNPVHYVRYAYVRIASIGRQLAERKVERLPVDQVNFGLLEHPTELALLQSLADLPDVVLDACNRREPHQVTYWLRNTAGQFHSFYNECKVLGDGVAAELTQARLCLIEAVQNGLKIGLGLIGVTTPEKMDPPEKK